MRPFVLGATVVVKPANTRQTGHICCWLIAYRALETCHFLLAPCRFYHTLVGQIQILDFDRQRKDDERNVHFTARKSADRKS